FSLTSFVYICIFLRSRKLIISVRGELSPSALKYGILRKKIVLLLYVFFKNKVLFHSTADKETNEIENVFKGVNIVNIPNLINPATRLEYKHKKEQFLFIGRIHPIKAIDRLIEGFAMSEKFKKSNFELIIAGVHSASNHDYYRKLNELVKIKK